MLCAQRSAPADQRETVTAWTYPKRRSHGRSGPPLRPFIQAAASCLLVDPGLVVPPWYRLLCPMRPRSRRTGTQGTAGTANGRICTPAMSAGGRAVAGSNPVSPIDGSPLSKRDFTFFDSGATCSEASWYQPCYKTSKDAGNASPRTARDCRRSGRGSRRRASCMSRLPRSRAPFPALDGLVVVAVLEWRPNAVQ